MTDAGVQHSGARRAERVRAVITWGFAAVCSLASSCHADRGGSGGPVASMQLKPARENVRAPTAERETTSAPLAERESELDRRPRAAPLPQPARLEPGANEEFDPTWIGDVGQALSEVDENAFATLVHDDKRVHPTTCRAWRALRTRGFVPKTALAEQVDAGALVRCGALEFLALAAPSRVSHVRHALNGAGPGTLPALLASATSKAALQARSLAAKRGLSLAEFIPEARTVKSELPGRLSIAEPASETRVIVNAEAWGDINADEIEDLLLSVLSSGDDGTYFDMRLIEITRTSPRAPLTVIAVLK